MASHLLTPDALASRLPAESAQRVVWIAFSGGLDSTVLLHLASSLRDRGAIGTLCALHIHHGLQAEADQWVEQVTRVCRALAVPLQVERVALAGDDNLEARARAARYQVFARVLKAGDCLLMAHHQRDQAETLLYRLCRGSGPRGLAAMPETRPLGAGHLRRPLLDYPRAALEDYARMHRLVWVEDPSNGDPRFDRNYLRAEILPGLTRRWPEAERQLARTAAHCAEEQALLCAYAREELAALRIAGAGLLAGTPALDWAALAACAPARQRLLLRTWLVDLGCALPQSAQLERICADLLTPRVDAEPCFQQPDWMLRRYRTGLYWLPVPAAAIPCSIDVQPGCQALPGNGQLCWQVRPGAGLVPGTALSLRYRDESAEPLRFALTGRRGRKSLKKWCQEQGVPPWLRGRLPLLFRADELVAVAGLGVLEGHQVAAGQPGLLPLWRPDGTAVNPD